LSQETLFQLQPWCNYSTKLELILPRISEKRKIPLRPAAVPPSGTLPRRKFCFTFLEGARKIFSIKEKQNFLLGFALTRGRRGFASAGGQKFLPPNHPWESATKDFQRQR
jgi:hypothetical protein